MDDLDFNTGVLRNSSIQSVAETTWHTQEGPVETNVPVTLQMRKQPECMVRTAVQHLVCFCGCHSFRLNLFSFLEFSNVT